MSTGNIIIGDWHPGHVPTNVRIDGTAYIETSYSFLLYRSNREVGLVMGRASSMYKSTMLDVGPEGRVLLGDYALLHGVRIICDAGVHIGHHTMVSWNVVILDTYRFSRDAEVRRRQLRRVTPGDLAAPDRAASGRPVVLGANVWVGFDAVILPGVSIGQGAIVGARSVVVDDVPPYAIVAGNPARVLRILAPVNEECSP